MSQAASALPSSNAKPRKVDMILFNRLFEELRLRLSFRLRWDLGLHLAARVVMVMFIFLYYTKPVTYLPAAVSACSSLRLSLRLSWMLSLN
jgi:hypothetical protein